MTRNFFVGGNWKMNGSKATIDTITDGLNATKVPEGVQGNWYDFNKVTSPVSVVCGAPDVYLTYAQSKITNSSVHVAAQNCYKEAKGAFTGETSADFLK